MGDPTPVAASALLGTTAVLSTGCHVLDACLGGGVFTKGITEVCGESSAGKTQLCLQLLLQAQLHAGVGGLDAGALYIATEGAAATGRLAAMAKTVAARHSLPPSVDLMARVFVEEVRSVDTLNKLLLRVPSLLRFGGVKLVVLDSLTALFRGDTDGFSGHSSASTVAQKNLLFKVAAQLKALAHAHGVVVVIVNQASTSMVDEDHRTPPDVPPMLVSSRVKPALGLRWSSCVTSRVLLSKPGTVRVGAVPAGAALTTGEVAGGPPVADTDGATQREMRLLFSPFAPSKFVRYTISTCGLRGTPP